MATNGERRSVMAGRQGMISQVRNAIKILNLWSYIGITLDFRWIEPATTAEQDQRAAETIRQFTFGWFAHPIFSKSGDYPRIMRSRIDAISKLQHFPRSRLPSFTKDEVEMIKGSADFLGLNHYTTSLASFKESKVTPQPSFSEDMGGVLKQKSDWPKSNSTWLRVVPWGFRKALNWVKDAYNNPLVIVTENGISLEALKTLELHRWLPQSLASSNSEGQM
ncbi:unnamed protein product [Leptosia nina]|uniref:beta-glucosidase n=1 Tax=Leptosia nina TaxID=320188 RepID=A0AAV1IVK7_9NEOP